jgi:hypothetical protein
MTVAVPWDILQPSSKAAQLTPAGRLVVATDNGHDIPHEQPKLILDAIRNIVLAVRAGDLVPTDERLPSQHVSRHTAQGCGPGRLPEQIGTRLP